MIAAPEKITAPDQDRSRVIARHVCSEFARDRVIKALFEAVVEGLEFGPRDLPRPEDRDWIRANIGQPLREASDAALEVLARSVCRTLDRAPEGFLDRYEKSHHLEDLGFE